MNDVHEPSWLVGSDRKNGHIEGAKPSCDFGKLRMQRGITGEEDSLMAKGDGPSAPQGGVAIPWIAPGKMLRRSAANRDAEGFCLLPPIELDHVRCTASLEKLGDAERYEPSHSRKSCDKLPDGCVVEMVVMVVRDESDVDGRKALEWNCGRHESPRPGERNR